MRKYRPARQISFQEVCEGKEKPEEKLQRDAESRKRYAQTLTL